MGQKVNPNGFRVGVIRDWNTHWFAAKKDFADCLVEDRKIRDFAILCENQALHQTMQQCSLQLLKIL